MKKGLVIAGAIMMGASVFMPVIYFFMMFIGFIILTLIVGGLDWLCCFGTSGLVFIIGLVLLIVGLVQND
ncbi:MAG: hypothetical protein ACMUIE_07065 [Thermoplasmatota archaeon]